MEPVPNRLSPELSKFWKKHIDAWNSSGLSQIDYCRQKNLSRTRFTYWKLKFEKQNLPQTFIEVSPKTVQHALPVKSINSITIRSASGFSVDVPQHFSSESLKQILSVLKEV